MTKRKQLQLVIHHSMIIKSCDNVSICPIGIKLRVKLRLGRGQERMYVQTSEEHRVQDYA